MTPMKRSHPRRHWWRAAMEVFLPAQCLLCDETPSPSYNDQLCEHCGGAWLPLPEGCARCGKPGADHAPLCSMCRDTPPPYRSAGALGIYEDPLAALIKRLKYHGAHALAPVLADAMADRIRTRLRPQPDMIVTPVPLHWLREAARGYNQARLLSQGIAEKLKLSHQNLLRRRKPSKAQARLGRVARRDNLSRAFEPNPKARRHIEGAAILLIDDVMTTGTTAAACSAALMSAGAASIDVFVCARAP